MMRIRIVVMLLMLAVAPVWAAQVVDFVPEGTVAQIDSIQVNFDEDIVPFGDAWLPAPVQLRCSADAAAAGAGRWLDARRWTYVFDQSLPAGIHCHAHVDPELRDLHGAPLDGPQQFEFATGGPKVLDSRPYGPSINEDQVFALRFNGRVDPDSLVSHTHCAVQGMGETVPVRAITGDGRADILDTFYDARWHDGDDVHLVQCKRRLPPEADVRLVVEPGVATLSANSANAESSADAAAGSGDVFEYTVRPAFTATISCQRENARTACLPVSDISVVFSAPIRRADAARITLRLDDELRSPTPESLEGESTLRRITFSGPFPPEARLVLHMPDALRDDADRPLENIDSLSDAFYTAAYPPLIKFASDTFGVIERFASVPDGRSEDDFPATVPLSLRAVESDLVTESLRVSAGTVNDYVIQDDEQALRWIARLKRLQSGHWTQQQLKAILNDEKIVYGEDGPRTDAREVSVLAGQAGTRQLQLPGAVGKEASLRPFEVVGVPLLNPGLHVLEVASPRLGKSLLKSAQTMYVRTLALVTNLGVHLKRGRDDTLVWVTTLDDNRVVPDAELTVMDCKGRQLTTGRTDEQGLWHYREPLVSPEYCEETGLSGVFVSARIEADHPQARGKSDYAFVLSEWDDGIEPWRFNLPVDTDPEPTRRVHTVLDRQLLRAGELVSMKHFLRMETRDGLSADIQGLPGRIVIEHQGSGEQHELALRWYRTRTGGLSAHTHFRLPDAARLGFYSVYAKDDDHGYYEGTEFRVEDFRLPVFTGSLQLTGENGESPLIAPEQLRAGVQLNYQAGGPAGGVQLALSALAEERAVHFDEFSEYSFQAPRFRPAKKGSETATRNRASADYADAQAPRIFLDKKSLQLDTEGGASVVLDSLPEVDTPQNWIVEASFSDPNGEVQTLAQTVPVWPAGLQAGIRSEAWATVGKVVPVRVVALTPEGRPRPGAFVSVNAVRHLTYSTRKRLVGGFYSYDHHREASVLGRVCEGITEIDGTLECFWEPSAQGDIELLARVHDDAGRTSAASASVWISGDEGLWFGGNDDDRIELVPAKQAWEPGEVAEFQVRMPFQHATALVSVERESVLTTNVQHLDSRQPLVRVPVQDDWGPNVYVSVLVLRGRVHSTSEQRPTDAAASLDDGTSVVPGAPPLAVPTPGTTIDLAKPSFRFGVAPLRVKNDHDRLKVKISADRDRYQTQERAMVDVQVTLPDGRPAAHGSIAFIAVDQALLELAPNDTWDVLSTMRRTRAYGVRTATAQMQIVGRRHYGRKALPSGGGGGKSPTRELLDTLLTWQPELKLDAEGKVRIPLQLNDAITRFQLVAIADHGENGFGTGTATIASTRDLYVIPGLPPTVRQGDQYEAQFTVRNMSERVMEVDISAQANLAASSALVEDFPIQRIRLEAGSAYTARWPVSVPVTGGELPAAELQWRLRAQERTTGQQAAAVDELRLSQQIWPRIPVRVQQSTALWLRGEQTGASVSVSAPADAAMSDEGRVLGGLLFEAAAGPEISLDGVRQWFAQNTYGGLEQQASKAVGLQDAAQWAALMSRLPAYQDDDGLLAYFPGLRQGDDVLTAWLLILSDEAAALDENFVVPDAARAAMLRGLEAFVQGEITRKRRAPVDDLDMRKRLALDALARFDKATPSLFDSVRKDPDGWPTSTVIDWLEVLQRVKNYAQRDQAMAQLRRILRARMLVQGTTQIFADSQLNASPWLMSTASVNQARLLLATLNDSEWDGERHALVQGLINMQGQGHWGASTANVFASLALRAFQEKTGDAAVSGDIHLLDDDTGELLHTLSLGDAVDSDGIASAPKPGARHLNAVQPAGPSARALLPWARLSSGAGSQPQSLRVEYEGRGEPWVTLSALAAVAHTQPVSGTLKVRRALEPVSQATVGRWSRGDVYRVSLELEAKAPLSWIAVNDAIPPGARILGSGLGRDASIPAREAVADTQHISYPPRFVERRETGLIAYFDYLPPGKTTLHYLVQLNTAGEFHLPPTRAEALYEPDVYAEWPMEDVMRVYARDASKEASSKPLSSMP